MTERTFYFKDGSLWWRDWCWGDDDHARKRMVRQAGWFDGPGAKCPDLASECREALRDFDAFWAENEDEELRWMTESADAR